MKSQSRGARLLMILAGLLLLCWLAYTQIKPTVESVAEYQTRVYAARVINEAVLKELAREGVGYGDIISVSRGKAGEVTALESDMLKINRLKAEITGSVIEELETAGIASLYLPWGTLMGGELTAGRGPLVEIRVYPAGYVQTELYSQFTDAGINQTLHQVMLGISVEMRAIIPGYNIRCDVSTNYCIAQTVIVGGIPEAYTQINGDNAPLISKINDYS